MHIEDILPSLKRTVDSGSKKYYLPGSVDRGYVARLQIEGPLISLHTDYNANPVDPWTIMAIMLIFPANTPIHTRDKI